MRAAGQPQSEVADSLGVDQTQVSRRQSGRAAWSLDDEGTATAAEERRALREELGLSRAHAVRAHAVRALGVSPSMVGGWESGPRARRNPRRDN